MIIKLDALDYGSFSRRLLEKVDRERFFSFTWKAMPALVISEIRGSVPHGVLAEGHQGVILDEND